MNFTKHTELCTQIKKEVLPESTHPRPCADLESLASHQENHYPDF